MTLLGAVLAILTFIAVFTWLDTLQVALSSASRLRQTLAGMRDNNLGDDEKERLARSAGLSMLWVVFTVAWHVTAALVASVVPVLLLQALGLVRLDDVLAFLSRIDVLVATFVIVGGLMYVLNTRVPRKDSNYSFLDRTLHRLAFSGTMVQGVAADLEDKTLGKTLDRVPDTPPVFITSLARAGTTILLEALNVLPNTATHTYRDMPFVMSPLLWARLRGNSGTSREAVERAHGDGLKVDFDSPEAFEEVIWRHFYPRKYSGQFIDLWTPADRDEEPQSFFQRHFRKVIALRLPEDRWSEGRYVSKNNSNIAKLALLPEMFPGARIVVPVRDPLDHSASLLRQHRNFLHQHAEDRFAARYMRDLGHFEFGETLKPFGFPGLQQRLEAHQPDEPDFWLCYWIASFEEVARHLEGVTIVDSDRLAADPQKRMAAICEHLSLEHDGIDFRPLFNASRTTADPAQFSESLVDEAYDLMEVLRKNAI